MTFYVTHTFRSKINLKLLAYHMQTYVWGPKRNRNFVIKNCVLIFRCYKLSHLQNTVHLMQCTGLNMFSTFRSSPETLAK